MLHIRSAILTHITFGIPRKTQRVAKEDRRKAICENAREYVPFAYANNRQHCET